MKLQLSLLSLFFCLVFLFSQLAQALPKNFPQALLYKNKPIDSLCIFEADKSNVSLKKCGIQASKDRKISPIKSDLSQKGFIGFDYIWPIDENDKNQNANAYSYYKVIDKIGDEYVIYALNNSGGSGSFSNIFLVKRQNDTLEVKSLAGGDRCNGGINKVEVKNQQIIYNANITPADFLDLTKQKSTDNAEPALAYCAVCCVATANLEINLKEKRVKLVSVQLDKDAEANTQGQHQACFNRLIEEYKKQGHSILKPEELNEMMSQFKQKCG